MRYTFRPLPELYWGVIVAAGTVLLIELASLNPDGIVDLRTWGVALGAAAIRAAAGAALDYVRRSMTQEPEPPTVPLPAVDTALVTALADELERRREERIQARLRAVEGAG